MAITTATNQMTKSYFDIAVNYDKLDRTPTREETVEPPKKQMSLEENDEYNELWDEFRDEEDTIH